MDNELFSQDMVPRVLILTLINSTFNATSLMDFGRKAAFNLKWLKRRCGCSTSEFHRPTLFPCVNSIN